MDSRTYVLVTSVGTDRPGIVEDLSLWILKQGGNIEDSRMSLLGGEFATLILVSGLPGVDTRLAESRSAFEQQHKLTVFSKAVAGVLAHQRGALIRYSLKATSLDHPGIVHQVAQLLRENSINIFSAETRTTAAPFSGAPVFQFAMEIDIPAEVAINDLREKLRGVGDRENIDFALLPSSEL